MGSLPLAEVFAVQLYGDGPPQCLGQVTIRCPYCQTLHSHRVFSSDTIVFARTAPCSAGTSARRYCVDLNARVPKRNVPLLHSIHAAGENLNDNAIDEPALNWEE